GGMVAMGAWGISPYVVLAWIAWRVRARVGPIAVLLLGVFVIATPVVAFLTPVGMYPGGDGQLGLGLMIYPFIQWLGVVLVGAICVGASGREPRMSRGLWVMIGAIVGFCL